MSVKWAIAPAAIGLAGVLGCVGVTGIVDLGSDQAANGSSSATATEWDHGRGGSWEDQQGYGLSESTTTSSTLSATAASAAEAVSASVVNIDTVLDFGTGEAAGTGTVLSSEGLVLTNHHVVEGATEITGTVVGTGKTYTATVLGYDADSDIAVIQLTGASDLPVASLDDDDDLSVGDLVVGVGNAGGTGGEPTAVEGSVTELGSTITATDETGGNAETLDNLIGTDADIRAGQSGGPMVDAEGEVVGVDVAASSGYSPTKTTGYAIPIDDALAVAQQIIAGDESGTVQIGATPFLGVELADTSTNSTQDYGYGYGFPGGGFGQGYRGGFGDGNRQSLDASDEEGVLIAGVVSDSAAEQAGLTGRDTLTALNGSAVTSADQLSSVIAAAEVGDRMKVTWTDASGNSHTASVTLGEGPVG